MKKQFQIRSFELRPGKGMQEDLVTVNNFLRQAEIMQAFSVTHKGEDAAVLLFLEHIREKKSDASPTDLSRDENRQDNVKTTITAEQLKTMELLKAWRSAKAAQLQLPVFMILPNMAIESIAIDRPETITHLTAMKGMGPIRAQKYGKEILEVLHGVVA